MDVGYVLRRGWQITWRHRILWVFGFPVGLGTMGVFILAGGNRWMELIRPWLLRVYGATGRALSLPVFLVLVLLVGVVIGGGVGLGLALWGARGRIGLVDQARGAEDRGVVDPQAGWRVEREQVWQVFLIRLVLGLPTTLVALAGGLPLIGTRLLVFLEQRPEILVPSLLSLPFTALVCLAPALGLAALLFVPTVVWQRLSVRAAVLEKLGLRQSVVRGWQLLRENLGPVALLWLALAGIAAGVAAVVGLPLFLLLGALMALAVMAVFFSPALFAVLTALGWLLAWLVGAAVVGVVETFFSAVWTLAYRELAELGLTGEEPPSPPVF